MLVILNDGWKFMFKKVIKPTINHISELLGNNKLNNCKYLCLVGGLSTSQYFQYKMTKAFGPESKYKLKIIIPHRPILSVVEGAAYFGITPNYIKARVLRYTYGEILNSHMDNAIARGIPKSYIQKNKWFNEYKNSWMVRGCFKPLASKNEEIYVGDVRRSLSSRSSSGIMGSKTQIVWSKLKDPKVHTDVMTLGKIETNWSNNDQSDMGKILEFHFAETIIKAIVYRNKDPDNQQTCYITNFM